MQFMSTAVESILLFLMKLKDGFSLLLLEVCL